MWDRIKSIKGPFVLYLLEGSLLAFGLGFVPLYFRQAGYPLFLILFSFVLVSAMSILLPVVVNRINVRRFLVVGMLLFALMPVVLLLSSALWAYYVYTFLFGLSVLFYWIPINYLFFATSKKERHGRDASLYFLAMAFAGMLFPAVGALVIAVAGFSALFGVVSVLQVLLAWYAARHIPAHTVESTFKKSLRAYRGIGFITMLNGSIEYFMKVVVPIYVLLFFQTEMSYGGFLTYLGVLGAIVAVFVATHSDRRQRRLRFMTPFVLLMVAFVISLGYIDSLSLWLIVFGAYVVADGVSKPLFLAVLMDPKQKTLGFWRVREVFLHAGRLITMSIALVFFVTEQYQFVFLFYGLVLLAYLATVHFKVPHLQAV